MTQTNDPARADEPVADGGSRGSVSVVVPTWCVAPWIEDCLESLLREAVVGEVLVIDDASTDETVAIAHRVAARDARVRVYRNPGRGSAAGRNFGVSLATGTYLAFADGDDISAHGGLEALTRSLTVSGSDFAVADYIVFTPRTVWSRQSTLPVYGEPRSRLALADEPRMLRDRVCWNKVFRLDWWRASSIAFNDSHQSNDIAAMTQAYLRGVFDVVDRPVYLYRRQSGGSSMTARRAHGAGSAAYLEQERICHGLLSTHASQDVVDAYLDGVLEFDLWSQVTQVIDAVPRGEASTPVLDDFASFLKGVPDHSIAGLASDRRSTYTLLRGGRSDLAVLVAATTPLPTVTDAELTAVGRLLGEDARPALARLLRIRVIRPLLDGPEPPAPDADLARALVHLQRNFVPRGRLSPMELALLDAAALEDAGALEAVWGLRRDPVRVVVRSSATRMTITLPAGATDAGAGFVLVHPEGTSLVPIVHRRGVARAILRAGQVRPGVSELYLQVRRWPKLRIPVGVAAPGARGPLSLLWLDVPASPATTALVHREHGLLRALGRRTRRRGASIRQLVARRSSLRGSPEHDGAVTGPVLPQPEL